MRKLNPGQHVKVIYIQRDDPPEAYRAARRFAGRHGRVLARHDIDPTGPLVGESPESPCYTVRFPRGGAWETEIFWPEELARRRSNH